MINKQQSNRKRCASPFSSLNEQEEKNSCKKKKIMKDSNTNLISSLMFSFIFLRATFSANVYLQPSLYHTILSNTWSEAARKKPRRVRRSWTDEESRFDDRTFFCLFCMSKPYFNKLCSKIEVAIGSKNSSLRSTYLILNTAETFHVVRGYYI